MARALHAGESDRLGPYKLIERIGEGGMGSVWMAQQTDPIRRTVALKLIKPGMDSCQVLARFEAERQALALMDHPHIAKVFDAGKTSSGQPYFVMELVKGIPITNFCDARRLSIRERLALFIPVCQAVQHAHQKGIIHRDLKPSNVLVALYDGRPLPKVIDFGLAKAMGPTLTGHTLHTGVGMVLGTLEYMSPEQAEVNQVDIDTRSDLYSLGVLLYELLTGTTPLRSDQLRQGGWDDVLRRIREEEPPRPSTRLSELQAAGKLPSPESKIQNPNSVRGDLDWIVMKVLDKDRNRRYETANGLALDLQRYLQDEPVLARPPSTRYRLQKFVRKHRAPVSAAAGFVVLLALATAVSSALAIQANRERSKAWTAQQSESRERGRAEASERRMMERLWESYLAQARANRWSGRAGRRFDSLVVLSNAAAIRPAVDLRDETIACLALTDARPLRRLRPPSAFALLFDPERDRYAVWDKQGEITLCDSLTDQPMRQFASPAGRFSGGCFLRSAPLLMNRCRVGGTNFCQVWETERGQLLATLPDPAEGLPIDFDPRTQRLALGHEDGTIGLYALARNQPPTVLRTRLPVRRLQFHPRLNQLAGYLKDSRTVTIWDLEKLAETQSLAHPQPVRGLAWGADGALLAVGCRDSRVYVWRHPTGERLTVLEGHEGEIRDVFFDPSGALLGSVSQESMTRFWEPWSGRLLLVLDGWVRGFSLQGDRVTVGSGFDLSLREFTFAREYEFFDPRRIDWQREAGTLPSLLQEPVELEGYYAQSADGRYLATVHPEDTTRRAHNDVILTDLIQRTVVKRLEVDARPRVGFSPDCKSFAIATSSGYLLYTAPGFERVRKLTLDPAGLLPPVLAFAPHEQMLALACARNAIRFFSTVTGEELATVVSPYTKILEGLRFSADGNQLAAFYKTGAAEIWHLQRIRRQLASLKLDWTTPGGLGPSAQPDATGRTSRNGATRSAPQNLDPSAASNPRSGLGGASVTLSEAEPAQVPPRDPRARVEQIDLSRFYNVSLTNRWLPRSEGGGLSRRTLAALPQGLQPLGGMVFDVRGFIQLSGAGLERRSGSFPLRVDQIPIGLRCRRLHFLQAVVGNSYEGELAGYYQVQFETEPESFIPIAYGAEVRSLDPSVDRSIRLARGETVWTATNVVSADGLAVAMRLFKSSWTNPRPTNVIRHLDFVSARTHAAPLLVAITAE